MTKTLTRTITAALLIAALAVPAAAATTADIGVEKAKEAALSHAGVAESDTVFLIAEADYDDGRKEYEVEFYAGGTEYDYTIDAASGRVLKFDTELEWYSADDDAGYGWQNVIGKQKAQEIALADAGVAAGDALHLIVKPDWDDGVRIYEVEFYTASQEYDYEIHAETGDILSRDREAEWNGTAASGSSNTGSTSSTGTASASSTSSTASASTADIGEAKAKSVALSHAGISESDTSYIYAKKDWDDGRWVYDVEFWADGKEYDYEILASDGTILSYDYDAEYQWSGSSSTGSTSSTADIGEAKAKSVALSHAGISESDTSYIYAKKDWDDGRWVYDVEFWADGKEYDYEILASDGTILSYDYDAEYQWNGSSSTSGDTISTEKVKSIVTDRAGVSGTFRELKLERDDGRTVYEGEMRSGRTDYEFTIDAYTGAVLEWDTDWDD